MMTSLTPKPRVFDTIGREVFTLREKVWMVVFNGTVIFGSVILILHFAEVI